MNAWRRWKKYTFTHRFFLCLNTKHIELKQFNQIVDWFFLATTLMLNFHKSFSNLNTCCFSCLFAKLKIFVFQAISQPKKQWRSPSGLQEIVIFTIIWIFTNKNNQTIKRKSNHMTHDRSSGVRFLHTVYERTGQFNSEIISSTNTHLNTDKRRRKSKWHWLD